MLSFYFIFVWEGSPWDWVRGGKADEPDFRLLPAAKRDAAPFRIRLGG